MYIHEYIYVYACIFMKYDALHTVLRGERAICMCKFIRVMFENGIEHCIHIFMCMYIIYMYIYLICLYTKWNLCEASMRPRCSVFYPISFKRFLVRVLWEGRDRVLTRSSHSFSNIISICCIRAPEHNISGVYVCIYRKYVYE